MRWETDVRLMKRRAHARAAAISAFIFALEHISAELNRGFPILGD